MVASVYLAGGFVKEKNRGDAVKIIDINGEKVLGHGNDITYNPSNDTFYVTSGLTDNKVYSFKIINNEIIYSHRKMSDHGTAIVACLFIIHVNKSDERFIRKGI